MGTWNINYICQGDKAHNTEQVAKKVWENGKNQSEIFRWSRKIESDNRVVNDQAKKIDISCWDKLRSEKNRINEADWKERKWEKNGCHWGLNDLRKSQSINRRIIYSSRTGSRPSPISI